MPVLFARQQRSISAAFDDPMINVSRKTWARWDSFVSSLKDINSTLMASTVPAITFKGNWRVVNTSKYRYTTFNSEFTISYPSYKNWRVVLDGALPGSTVFSSKYPLGASLQADGHFLHHGYGVLDVWEQTTVTYERNVYRERIDVNGDGVPDDMGISTESRVEYTDRRIGTYEEWQTSKSSSGTATNSLPGR